jgi:hypothetical protein
MGSLGKRKAPRPGAVQRLQDTRINRAWREANRIAIAEARGNIDQEARLLRTETEKRLLTIAVNRTISPVTSFTREQRTGIEAAFQKHLASNDGAVAKAN